MAHVLDTHVVVQPFRATLVSIALAFQPANGCFDMKASKVMIERLPKSTVRPRTDPRNRIIPRFYWIHHHDGVRILCGVARVAICFDGNQKPKLSQFEPRQSVVNDVGLPCTHNDTAAVRLSSLLITLIAAKAELRGLSGKDWPLI